MSQGAINPDPSDQSAARRALLIDATLSAIATHGFSNITLAKIAGLAGLTAGTVNFHFDSKEALLLATLRQVADEFDQAVQAAGASENPQDRLLAIITAAMHPSVMEPRKVTVWYAFMAEASGREDYQRICGERERRYAQLIDNACEELIQSEAQTQVHAGAVSRAIRGLIDDVWQEVLFSPESYVPGSGERICKQLLASLLPSCFRMPVETEPASDVQSQLTYTLPAWVYTSADFLRLEQQRLFPTAWQMVCHISELERSGSYVTFQLFNEKVFVIRDSDQNIQAFHNVCRHRAHVLLADDQGCTDSNRIVCPYHGWTYGLSGERIAMGFPDSFRQHDAQEFGLQSVDCEVYRGFVFIRFKSDGTSVATRMAPVDEEFSNYQTEAMTPAGAEYVWSEEAAVNWKNAAENYLEDYHFFMGHPGLSSLMKEDYDRDAFDTDLARLSHEMREQPKGGWSVRAYHSLLPEQAHLPERLQRRWNYYALYPNTFFDVYPDAVDVFQLLPVSPDRTILRSRTYWHASESRQHNAVRYLNGRINTQVQVEDNLLTESVQQGLRSSSYQRGVLSDKEVLVKHFGDYIRRVLPEARELEGEAR